MTLEHLRPRLADRRLAEVRPSNLWEVLGDPRATGSAGGPPPRLNILPVRTREEYRSFREAFIRLLSLKNVSSREFRQLVITCHARDITCDRIGVAAEHREEFDLAEQAERGLRFTRIIAERVEEGRDLREDTTATVEQIRREAPAAAAEMSRATAVLNAFRRSSTGRRRR